MKRSLLLALAVLLLLSSSFMLHASAQQEDDDPPQAYLEYPPPGNVTSETMPVIVIRLLDSTGVDPISAVLVVDGFDVSDWEETSAGPTNITYSVPEVLAFKNGLHYVNLTISDTAGNIGEYSWNFTVDTSYRPVRSEEVDYFRIFVIITIIAVAIAMSALVILIVYLRVTRDFNVIKFIRRNPPDLETLMVFVPMAIGALVTIGGLLYVFQYDVGGDFKVEYLLLAGALIFIGSYAVFAQVQKRRIGDSERAFSQLLFEMADAMRGGIDPAKALIEISTTDTGVLRDRLRIAAKNIKAGRPFEEVMENLAASTNSDIVKRYTSLVTESAKVGGEVSIVLHRSAKDMDDIIRVRAEKRRQLSMQIFTIYLAFAVLAAILYMLIDLYPQLMKLDLSILFNFNLNAAVADQGSIANRMSFIDLKRRFFHLVLINSIGSGILIGKLIDGKLKYGLIHSLVLMIATALFFYFLII